MKHPWLVDEKFGHVLRENVQFKDTGHDDDLCFETPAIAGTMATMGEVVGARDAADAGCGTVDAYGKGELKKV